jgi:hypothetical protein
MLTCNAECRLRTIFPGSKATLDLALAVMPLPGRRPTDVSSNNLIAAGSAVACPEPPAVANLSARGWLCLFIFSWSRRLTQSCTIVEVSNASGAP